MLPLVNMERENLQKPMGVLFLDIPKTSTNILCMMSEKFQMSEFHRIFGLQKKDLMFLNMHSKFQNVAKRIFFKIVFFCILMWQPPLPHSLVFDNLLYLWVTLNRFYQNDYNRSTIDYLDGFIHFLFVCLCDRKSSFNPPPPMVRQRFYLQVVGILRCEVLVKSGGLR